MLTGDLKSKIDQIWNAFWSGGIANPIEVIEQITYLLFLRRLDDLHTLEENKANRLKKPMERRIFPEGADSRAGRTTACAGAASRTNRPARCLSSWANTSSPSCAPWARTIRRMPTT
ncbi:type I restriction-modification system subunit M N-terminal domain-containing protein [Rhodoferax sp.]|uniref:type I restriction-modification system subunit M N-terminal domain-containing protein n=1 Tax=Rhodoferax sp. TaxID=50421 RepID=UPI00276EC9DB|nr:type I restriction-modification system subunit M N-terminal domain-containing protein [Rhodoferax sp.]